MDSTVKYLLSLQAVRDRAEIVAHAAQAGKLNHFDFHQDRMADVADTVAAVIKRDYGPNRFHEIPPHGRWQHFDVGNIPRVANLIQDWKKAGCNNLEIARRLVDLFFVSVLLDAGAGDHWRYVEPGTHQTYERSEGIAVASLHMFNSLVFTADNDGKAPLVDGKGLERFTAGALAEGFQASDTNPMLGIDSRAHLLRSLGISLLAHSEVFGTQGRPGNLVDYMVKSTREPSSLDVLVLWDILQTLLIPIWPKDRTTINGHPIGDAWPLALLQDKGDITASIQPFHKLTQWLTYSLMVPFQRVLGYQWRNAESLTGLPEYRNGGLFIDLGALSLRQQALDRGLKASSGSLPLFEPGDDVIVEWRAITLVLINKLYGMVLDRLDGVYLTMPQLLEAGTWKSGREMAAKLRPESKSSPILLKSDGTVF